MATTQIKCKVAGQFGDVYVLRINASLGWSTLDLGEVGLFRIPLFLRLGRCIVGKESLTVGIAE